MKSFVKTLSGIDAEGFLALPAADRTRWVSHVDKVLRVVMREAGLGAVADGCAAFDLVGVEQWRQMNLDLVSVDITEFMGLPVFKKISVGSFGWVSLGKDAFCLDLNYRYEHHCGGNNGCGIANIQIGYDGRWSAVLANQRHVSGKLSIG